MHINSDVVVEIQTHSNLLLRSGKVKMTLILILQKRVERSGVDFARLLLGTARKRMFSNWMTGLRKRVVKIIN